MKGDLHPAAFRLSTALPTRTHEQRIITHVQGSKSPPHIIIKGVRYPSVLAAARELRKDRSVIRGWLKSGEAHYA